MAKARSNALLRVTKTLLFLACLGPLARLAWRAWGGNLTANPIEYITHFTGDWTIRLIVGRAFQSYDCQLSEAANGEAGLAVAAREKPALILLDVTMPVMDGVTMLTKLKEDPALKAIPVVMLTAESGRDNVLQIAKLGVRD